MLEFFQRRQDSSAPGMPQNHHQSGVEPSGRKLHAADLRRGNDVAGDSDDEEVSGALIEYDLCGYAGV